MPVSTHPQKWHAEDIKAAVRKRGTTLAALARSAGIPPSACQNALKAPHSHGEAVISEFLGIPMRELWPDRFDAQGRRIHGTRLPAVVDEALARLKKLAAKPGQKSKPQRAKSLTQNARAA